MNKINVFRLTVPVLLIALTATAAHAFPAKKFSPEGTWEYSAPQVTEGYQTGEMIIAKTDEGYGVILVFFGTQEVKANKVEYEKKSLKLTIYIEAEAVTVKGTFDKDEFTGTVSYSEGVFDITATRKKEEKE